VTLVLPLPDNFIIPSCYMRQVRGWIDLHWHNLHTNFVNIGQMDPGNRLAVDLISQFSLPFKRGKLTGKVGENWSTVKQDKFSDTSYTCGTVRNRSPYKLPVRGVNIWDVRIANGPTLALLITIKSTPMANYSHLLPWKSTNRNL
jgi:hypothetical protein